MLRHLHRALALVLQMVATSLAVRCGNPGIAVTGSGLNILSTRIWDSTFHVHSGVLLGGCGVPSDNSTLATCPATPATLTFAAVVSAGSKAFEAVTVKGAVDVRAATLTADVVVGALVCV